MEMNRKIIGKGSAVGLVCGALGVALTVVTPCFGEAGSFLDLHVLPAVIVALFVGSFAGIVAGAVAAVGLLVSSLFCPALGSAVPMAAGTLLAALVAAVARKWMFYDGKPAALPAVAVALAAQVANLACVVLFGADDESCSLSAVLYSAALQGVGVAIVAAVASLAFRARQTLWANVSSTVLLAVVALIVQGVWFVQNRDALEKTVTTAEGAASDAIVGVDSPFEPEMLRFAELSVEKWRTAEAMAKTDLSAYAKEIGYDFIGIVDVSNRIIACNQGELTGVAIADREYLKEFADFDVKKSSYCVQPFTEVPLGGATNRVIQLKLVAKAFPEGGGFALYGDSLTGEADLRERDYLFESPMQDWHVGENGSLLLVDPKVGRVVSGMEREYTGMTVEEAGLTTLSPLSRDLMVGTVLGEVSLVRKTTLDFVPLDVYVIQPYSEVMRSRDLSVLIILLVLTVFFFSGAIILMKIRRQENAISQLRAREDEKRQKDMDLAKSIQISSLVKEFPEGVHAVMRPAREVGGDFYDCFECAPGKLMLVIADVSGKGIPASLFMMRARTEFRAVSKELGDIAEIMGEVNSRLCKNNDAEMFVTAWIGRLDLATGEIEWVSAGHNPPYVVRADGKIEQVTGKKSLVLAGYDGVKYSSNSLRLEKGDWLVLYTDGVTEAQSVTGDFFGESRLEKTLAGLCGVTPAVACGMLFGAVDAFAKGAPQADDITVLAVRI